MCKKVKISFNFLACHSNTTADSPDIFSFAQSDSSMDSHLELDQSNTL